ncbi:MULTISPECIES: ankyrin repeat domain-containing protein [Streptomyces]|uniref:ankyrin repeat domain-containing protein n=1 Tax=Streptomyces TaxID=1883 RepID=UPI001FFA21B5|nr:MULTISPECIES: ankyrin repeat domain-containing protein [Streptomyces]MCC8452870.1 ankyrin repeat domain-containing protein [Streptomyces rochei]
MVENIWTQAHQAVEDGRLEELARLLDAGADPNEVCCGMTLLGHAVDYEADSAIQNGEQMGVGLIALLLAYGASPRVDEAYDKSALRMAAEYGHDMAYRLLERSLRGQSAV